MLGNLAAAVATNVIGNQITASYNNMATTSPYAKDVANNVYHAAIVYSLMVGYTLIGKKLLKIKTADLEKLDVVDGVKVIATITLALGTQDLLVKKGLIPANIIAAV